MFLRNLSNNILRPINTQSCYLKSKTNSLSSCRNYRLTRKKNTLNMTIKEPLVWIDCEVNVSNIINIILKKLISLNDND